jgi:5-methylcytosine-specific restriction endonuclease McrA
MKTQERQDLKDLHTEPQVSGSRLDQFRILALNADFRPFSYYPLSTVHWQKVMFWYVKGMNTGIRRFNVVALYPDVFVHHGRDGKIQLPSVISHMEFRKPPKNVPMTKFNVFLRDDFECQWSGEKCSPKDLSWDHVNPRCNGGKTTWNNIVSAKRQVNELKDDLSAKEFEKRYGYVLRRQPYEPTWGELYNKGKKYPPRYLHETWHDYLYWDTPLEE